MTRRHACLAAALVLLLAWAPCVEAETRLIDADTFFGQYGSALDSFTRLQSFVAMHDLLERRISVSAFVSMPMVRSLASTSYGLLDVTPTMSYMAVLLEPVRTERFSWLLLFTSGVSQLSPNTQPTGEGETAASFTPIFKAQILLLNDLSIGSNLKLRLGWEHWEESERDGELLVIRPGEATFTYSISPLEDRFLLRTDAWRFLLDVVVRRGLDTLGLGRAWDLPFVKRLYTGAAFDRIASLATLGPRLEVAYGPLSLAVGGGYVFSAPAGSVPLHASAGLGVSHELTLLQSRGGFLVIPLYAAASGSYRGQEEPLERLDWGFKVRSGLVLKPPRGSLPRFLLNLAFHLTLSVSRNDPEDLVVMPERDAVIGVIDFGFHFL